MHRPVSMENDMLMKSEERGKVGWALLWLLGIPLPVLIVLYLLIGHH